MDDLLGLEKLAEDEGLILEADEKKLKVHDSWCLRLSLHSLLV